jgi:hypothetical protein
MATCFPSFNWFDSHVRGERVHPGNTAYGHLLVEYHAGHDDIGLSVERNRESAGSSHARVGHRTDYGSEELCEGCAIQELTNHLTDPVLYLENCPCSFCLDRPVALTYCTLNRHSRRFGRRQTRFWSMHDRTPFESAVNHSASQSCILPDYAETYIALLSFC